MATGGVEVYSRVTCSVCLEPYGGRQAKILPCFHTFCLPCLAGLVKRRETTETSDTPGLVADEEGEQPADSLTCPTCRRIIPVPAGGVVAFQTNFYLDTCKGEDEVPPVPCYLCDGEHPAQLQCSECQNNFCSQCQRYHDKLCQGDQVRALEDPSDDSGCSTAQNPTQCQVRQQLQMVEDALKKLTEGERKLNQERGAMNDSINVRYATLLGLAADARDACCLSLRGVCDGLTEQLHSSMAEARQTRDTLQQQLSSSQPAPVSASLVRAGLFLLGDLQMILNRDLDSSSLLQHHMEENTSLTMDSLRSFMGNVTKRNHSSSLAQEKASLGSLQDCGAVSSTGAGAKSLSDLYEQVEDLAGQVIMLQSTITQLSQHVTLLSNAHGKLSTEQSALLREMTALKEKNIQLTTEQAGLQREVTAMRDRHVIVHQDLAVLTAEKDKVSAQLEKLQKDIVCLQTDTFKQTTDIVQLKAVHGDVVAKVSRVQTDITALQGDEASTRKDVSQLKTDCSELTSKMAKAQSSLSDLTSGQFTQQAAMAVSKLQVASLQQKVKSAEDAHQDHKKTLATLESRFVRANTQVAFHSLLSTNLTTDKEQTLICDDVIKSVGNGYDQKTGIFTAPFAGTYCFLATTSPFKGDVTKSAKLDIVLDDKRIGHVFSLGNHWSTGHAVVKMATGQKVWLRTFGDKEQSFGARWWTSFSGMLVQADV